MQLSETSDRAVPFKFVCLHLTDKFFFSLRFKPRTQSVRFVLQISNVFAITMSVAVENFALQKNSAYYQISYVIAALDVTVDTEHVSIGKPLPKTPVLPLAVLSFIIHPSNPPNLVTNQQFTGELVLISLIGIRSAVFIH